MANTNHKARRSKAPLIKDIAVTLSDVPQAPSTATITRPQQAFMPWEHIDRWLGTTPFFKAGQRVYISVDHIRGSLTVTREHVESPTGRVREQRAQKREAENEELSRIWRAQLEKRPRRASSSRTKTSNR